MSATLRLVLRNGTRVDWKYNSLWEPRDLLIQASDDDASFIYYEHEEGHLEFVRLAEVIFAKVVVE